MVKKLLIGLVMVMVMVGVGYAQTPSERCFTFNGTVMSFVNNMNTGGSSGSLFQSNGYVAGDEISYDVCVDNTEINAMPASLTSSSIGWLGGSGTDPSLGNPAAAYDFIYYDDPGAPYQILLGGPYENVSIQFQGLNIGSNGWQINDGFTIVHTLHKPINTTWAGITYTQMYYRMIMDGRISFAEPSMIPDSDGDGFDDQNDNCMYIPNDQMDSDSDLVGDACDPFPDCPDPNGDCGPAPIAYFPELGCDGMGDDCQGRYSLAQMGLFGGDGVWIWNQDFKDLMNSQHYSTPDTHPELWTPIKESGLITDGPWQNTEYRLDRRIYEDDTELTMLNLLLQTGESVKYPTVYLAQDPNCPECGQWVNVWFEPMNWPDGICVLNDGDDPHANCPDLDGDGNNWNDITPENPDICCRPFGDAMANPWVDMIQTEELTEERINFVKWENTGDVEYGPKSYDGGSFTMINYNLGARMWEFSYNAVYSENAPTLRYHFPSIINAIGNQIFTINYDEGIQDQLTIFASDVRAMPVIEPFSTYMDLVADDKKGKAKKSKKKIKATEQEMTVENILIREVVDPLNPDAGNALVVQWPEPDGALFGNMQLRVFVGANVPAVGQDDFLFLDAPVQTGTVVFPQDVWMPYKKRMLLNNNNEMSMHIMYRITSDRYQNRSNSSTTFQIQ